MSLPSMRQLERQKIVAEIAKLDEDLEKTKRDREKTEKDLTRHTKLFWLEVTRSVASCATFLVAIAAVVTFAWNVHTYRLESDRKQKEHLSSLFRDLDKGPPVRAAAIFSLMPYIHDRDAGDSILLAMTHMIAIEDEVDVHSAVLRTLKTVQGRSVPVLESARQRAISELEPLFTDLRKWDDRLAAGSPQGAVLEGRQGLERQIKRKQRGLVAIALALRDLTCPQAATSSCPPDLARFPLKQADLVGMHGHLARGKFQEAILWGSELFALDLRGADFTRAWLNEADFRQANLAGAVFIDTHIERVVNRTVARRLAMFEHADLTGAKFAGACLSGADFRGAIGLDVEQFKDAFAEGATFAPEFEAKMNAAGYLKSDKKCKVY